MTVPGCATTPGFRMRRLAFVAGLALSPAPRQRQPLKSPEALMKLEIWLAVGMREKWTLKG